VTRRGRVRLRSARPAMPAGKAPVMLPGTVHLRSARPAVSAGMMSVTHWRTVRLRSARPAMPAGRAPVMLRGRVHLRSARPAIPAGMMSVTRWGTVRLRSVRLSTSGGTISETSREMVAGRSDPLTVSTRRAPAARRGRTHHGPGRSRATLSPGARAGRRRGIACRRTRRRTTPSRQAAPTSANPRLDACQARRPHMPRPVRVSPRTGFLGRSVRGGSPARRRRAVRVCVRPRAGVPGRSVWGGNPAPARRMVPVRVGVQRPVPGPRTVLHETPIAVRRRARAAAGTDRGRPRRPPAPPGVRLSPVA
jgi:hypothetical protein